MIAAALTFLLLLATGPVEQILLEARHAEQVKGDFDAARRLYRKALDDKSLDRARQAEIRLRIAHCYHEMGEIEKALVYLEATTYERAEIPQATRREAERLRGVLRAKLPQPRADAPPREATEKQKRERVAEYLAEARRHLARNRLMLAYAAAQKALDLQPQDPDVRALDAQIRTRLSGVAAVLQSPLDFLRAWSDAQVKSVARQARAHMHAALRSYADRNFAAGEREFVEAIMLIDRCEFRDGSTELLDLRETIRERWRTQRERHFGAGKAEPKIPAREARSTPAADYLRQLQRMLDVLSSPDHEYRILPVAPRARASTPHSQRKPRGMVLERGPVATTWTLARFAHEHLRRRVEPQSWLRPGNFLDIAGEMLVARNHPGVLDRLQQSLRELERPDEATVRCEFLLVSVPTPLLDRFAKEFGAWKTSARTTDPLLYNTIPASMAIERVLGWLNDQGVEVRPELDRFATVLTNARGESLLAGQPLRDAPGYADVRLRGAPPMRRLYGVLLDVLPWRGEDGRGALGLRVTVRKPAPPVGGVARFVSQTGELYAGIPNGGTLVATGLVDPFAVDRGSGRSLMLFWSFPRKARTPSGETRGVEFELGVRRLLYELQTDDPGPRRDAERGFVETARLDALAQRATFLGARLKELLVEHTIHLDWEEAVLRVPENALEDARAAVDALEKEAKSTYLVEVETHVVRTAAFQRWMERSGLDLRPWGEAQLSVVAADEGRTLLRQLPSSGEPDLFAPKGRWAVLGLQARHLRATRTRTAPAIATEQDLAQRATETVTEGLVISVRPFLDGGRDIWADVTIETAGLEELREERALGGTVPAFRPRINGIRARKKIYFGTRTKPKIALICRVPHPIVSRPEALTEMVISVRVTSR
ncbi:MAG: tetratricopeptide repeat protein [Planctomycetota bacterium]|jgi:tetratricopeptide (TPR) repeat protein